MKIKRFFLYLKTNRQFLAALAMPVTGIVLLAMAKVLEEPFSKIMSVASYLTWHNLFELTGVIICIAIFLVSHYSYDQTGSLRTIILGNMLLCAGIIDVFHILSYKGMPDFFIENTMANRATTFWIAARLVSSFGFLFVSIISKEVKCTIKKGYFVAAALLIAFAVFITATWYPSSHLVMYAEDSGLTTLKIILEYFIMLILVAASASYLRRYIIERDKIMFTMFCALLLSVLSEFTFSIYVDVYGIYNYMGHIFKFISMFMIFRSFFIKNVQAPYIHLKNAQKVLMSYADNLDRTIEQRTKQLKIINARLMEDLEYARDIQKSMLPVFLPDTPEIGFSAVYLSAERISGDFYDVFKLDDRHLGFYICDVSGHGVPAAMLTVFLKQCVDSIVGADRHRGIISSPSHVLQLISDAFNHSNFKDDVYIVLMYSVYDMVGKQLVSSSAGLNEPPLLADAGGDPNEVEISGIPICRLNEVYPVTYTDFNIPIQSGSRLYLYTDGLVEARNSDMLQYTSERLKQVLKETCNQTLSEQTAAIAEDISSFSAGRKLNDDVTLLAVEIR